MYSGAFTHNRTLPASLLGVSRMLVQTVRRACRSRLDAWLMSTPGGGGGEGEIGRGPNEGRREDLRWYVCQARLQPFCWLSNPGTRGPSQVRTPRRGGRGGEGEQREGGGSEPKPLGSGSVSLNHVAGSAINSCILIQHASVHAVCA